MHCTPLSQVAAARWRAPRDLTDPDQGPHAMQLLLANVRAALEALWGCRSLVHRADPVVTVADNYDRLHYPPDGAARDARYSRYVGPGLLLRTHTSAMIPPLLRSLSAAPPADLLLVCPGVVYRRDVIDRLHTGEPHQADVWRIASRRLTVRDLSDMVCAVVDATVPGREHRVVPATHPYTTDGTQIDVRVGAEWVEVGECGLALPAILAESGLDPTRYAGLAMGLGLDRLVMLAKGIGDIRLLRSDDERIARQMLDLAPYRPVSRQPAARRDLSVMVRQELDPEGVGDRIREALGEDVARVESADVLSETDYERLPPAAIERMGAAPGQKNLLVRLTIRDVGRTLTSGEANEVRNRVYRALHEGTRAEWC
jgi:phenylalanyl-tRNA synthetase alpha chain